MSSVEEMFGSKSPRRMPKHFFLGCVHVDYNSAIRADTSKQHFSVAPRYWYVDADVRCEQCDEMFRFSADEQRHWYEEYGFYVDSFPRHCTDCRRERRRLKALHQEYDQSVTAALSSDDAEQKARVIEIVDQLCAAGEKLPKKVHDSRDLLAKQLARARRTPG